MTKHRYNISVEEEHVTKLLMCFIHLLDAESFPIDGQTTPTECIYTVSLDDEQAVVLLLRVPEIKIEKLNEK